MHLESPTPLLLVSVAALLLRSPFLPRAAAHRVRVTAAHRLAPAAH